MRLVQIDLSRSEPPHEHPDVVTGHVYLLKSEYQIPAPGGFNVTSGVAMRHNFHGYSTLQFHVGSHLAQFDPPGHNHSSLVELWEVLDEPDIPAVQALELLREERRQRRGERTSRRRYARPDGSQDRQNGAVDLLG